MKNLIIKLTEQELSNVVATIKQLDVRGFDSMDRLVGLVAFFEEKYKISKAAQAVEDKDNGTN